MSISLAFRPRQDSLPAEGGSWHPGAKPFELRVLNKETEIHNALALRHRAYVSIGYDVESDDGAYKDHFDSAPTTVLFGAYDGERLVGSMRLCFSHPWQTLSTLPCGGYYPALKAVKLQQTGCFVEISRLSIEPEICNTSYRTTLYAFLVRGAFTAAQAAGASMILIATRPDWVKFYKYMLGFETIGLPAFYPPGDFKITLLGGSLKQAKARQRMQNRFFEITDEEIVSMRKAIAPALSGPASTEQKIAV